MALGSKLRNAQFIPCSGTNCGMRAPARGHADMVARNRVTERANSVN